MSGFVLAKVFKLKSHINGTSLKFLKCGLFFCRFLLWQNYNGLVKQSLKYADSQTLNCRCPESGSTHSIHDYAKYGLTRGALSFNVVFIMILCAL